MAEQNSGFVRIGLNLLSVDVFPFLYAIRAKVNERSNLIEYWLAFANDKLQDICLGSLSDEEFDQVCSILHENYKPLRFD